MNMAYLNLKVKIVMKEDTQQLDEVVVVGYGVQKKAHLTGAISTVPMDEIQDLVGGDLASSLSGLVNGLSVSGGDARPGAPARLSIRGSGDVSALGSTAQEPLFVIDGFIYPNDVKVGNTMQNLGSEAFNNLDPSMIESISVLKDAAAAVYGARAANGVVLVTTKRGKMGAPQISYSGSFGITDAVGHAKMLNSYEYGRLWNAVKAADPLKTDLNPQLDLFQADELAAMRTDATGAITGKNYGQLGDYLWYRHTTADGIPAIEMYGIHIGENQATETSCPAEGTGWQPYLNSEGEPSMYISPESAFKTDSGVDKASTAGFYDANPDLKQYWPIPATTITNSQGTLFNDYGY